PGARGHGHGRRLLEHAVDRARHLGFERITLETATNLTTAIAMYTRFGFQPHTPDHMASRCDLAFFLDLVPENAIGDSPLGIEPLRTDAEAAQCARMMATSEPWMTLGRGYDESLAILRDATREV